MLRQSNDVMNFTLHARDGEIGRVRDLYFDDDQWVVRYLVVDTSKWLSGRKVLISPHAVRGFNGRENTVDVDLTREQIKGSPPIEEHMPVSRRFEQQYYEYYHWPYYWEGAGIWGPVAYPGMRVPPPAPGKVEPPDPSEIPGDPHLRSVQELRGYRLHGRDQEVGQVDDMVFDDHDWAVRYLVVDTKVWWPGGSVLIPSAWVNAIDWRTSEVRVELDRETIRRAPEFTRSTEITRDYEHKLHVHYGRGGYWEQRQAA